MADVRESLLYYRYNRTTGPLFCGRLLLDSPDLAKEEDDLDPDYGHSSSMFFGMHHALTDGTSNMHIFRFFISILNDVIANKPINDEEPMGTFISWEENIKVMEKNKELLQSDPTLMAKLVSEKRFIKETTPLFISVFPPSKDPTKTVDIIKILDQSTTDAFIQKCKREKVTVNSAVTAFVNAALVEIFVENGLIQDSYPLMNRHLVNLRRYWDIKVDTALGCNIHAMCQNVDTPRNIEHQVWDYARSLNRVIQDDVELGKVFLEMAFDDLKLSISAKDFEKYLLSSKKFNCDFIMSNLGNVTSLVTEGGDYVRITQVLGSTSIDKFHFPVIINCRTFRGKFTIIFSYNAGFVQKDIAEKLCSIIVKRISGVQLQKLQN
ncbi:hypothetical protein SK128_006677, partial [Halocaridina rubra]